MATTGAVLERPEDTLTLTPTPTETTTQHVPTTVEPVLPEVRTPPKPTPTPPAPHKPSKLGLGLAALAAAVAAGLGTWAVIAAQPTAAPNEHMGLSQQAWSEYRAGERAVTRPHGAGWNDYRTGERASIYPLTFAAPNQAAPVDEGTVVLYPVPHQAAYPPTM